MDKLGITRADLAAAIALSQDKRKLPASLLEKDFFILKLFFWRGEFSSTERLMSVTATKTRKHHYFKTKVDGDGAEKTHDSLSKFEEYLTQQGAYILDYES